MGLDIIKEYLVSIGFNVDKKGFADANNQLKTFEKILGNFAGSIPGKFVLAGAAVTTFSVVATGAIGKFLAETAKADIQVEMFARRMFTTEKNARSLKAVMDAMGIQDLEQLKDISLNPELRKQFMSLRNATAALEPGQDIQKALQDVRSVGFEFQKTKVLAGYFFMYVAGATVKHLIGPLGNLRKGMADFNEKLMKNMAKWADRVGKGLAMVVRFTGALFKLISLLDRIPNSIKAITLGVAALGAAIMAGPWGLLIGAISAIGLLADDYFTYKAGGQSALPGLWKGAEGIFGKLMEILNNIDANLSGIASVFGVGGQKAYNALKGAAAGAATGAATGAAVGSIVPGVGTAVGATVGAGLGAGVGGVMGWKDPVMQRIARAQAILESGNGKSSLARKYHNYFGIKGKGPAGSVMMPTQEFWGGKYHTIKAPFRVYHNAEESFKDHLEFLKKNKRYKNVWTANSFADKAYALQRAGYATDPNYAKKLIQIDKQQKQGGTTNQITININGAQHPEQTAQAVVNALKTRTSLNTRSMQGAYA